MFSYRFPKPAFAVVLLFLVSCANLGVDRPFSEKTKIPIELTAYYDGRCEASVTLRDGTTQPLVGRLVGSLILFNESVITPAGIAADIICSFKSPNVIGGITFNVFFKDNFEGFEENYKGDFPVVFSNSSNGGSYPGLQEKHRELELLTTQVTKGYRNIYEDITYQEHEYVPSEYSLVTSVDSFAEYIADPLPDDLPIRLSCRSLYGNSGKLVFSAGNAASSEGVYMRYTGTMAAHRKVCAGFLY